MSQDQALPELGHDGARLRAYARFVALACRAALGLASILVLADLLLIGCAVLLRYVFSSPIVGNDEIVASTLTALVMLAAPDVLRRNGHIGVDVLVGALPPRLATWASVWSCLSVLMVAALLIVNGWKAVTLSRTIGLLTEGHLEMPVWMLQLFLPLGGLLLALVAVELLWRALARPAAAQEAKAGEP
ncbi:TRAP transporter small permease subunit [Allopusillimonas soli]|uniref:TRAP transporter small permease protein n=1 Tax=Allopusillimonas soli TaxID=659016 RepID=A0A853FB77_9BURK|nr:TRAP transporter small permease subunit [Allopusillimonas soli]NYT37179.1 TRAP transporter small permease subunit [Allopusillimonas soli]TEA74819.1 TRAP transporter small permease subunit [Allopusillimonas soli]